MVSFGKRSARILGRPRSSGAVVTQIVTQQGRRATPSVATGLGVREPQSTKCNQNPSKCNPSVVTFAHEPARERVGLTTPRDRRRLRRCRSQVSGGRAAAIDRLHPERARKPSRRRDDHSRPRRGHRLSSSAVLRSASSQAGPRSQGALLLATCPAYDQRRGGGWGSGHRRQSA